MNNDTLVILCAASQVATLPGCPSNLVWKDDGLEKDLYIQTSTMTVLAMDGRRRWLDIHKLVSSVNTNLSNLKKFVAGYLLFLTRNCLVIYFD